MEKFPSTQVRTQHFFCSLLWGMRAITKYRKQAGAKQIILLASENVINPMSILLPNRLGKLVANLWKLILSYTIRRLCEVNKTLSLYQLPAQDQVCAVLCIPCLYQRFWWGLFYPQQKQWHFLHFYTATLPSLFIVSCAFSLSLCFALKYFV